ncbi:MAG: type II toxin-antitoxin system HicB family antitoxin [Rickettsiales bacterium]|nr:type II toxin-antitoxin system HicB family antitoxin [Rickettsiales bacterium]
MKKNNTLKYKGYYGSISFDEEAKTFYGKVEFIRDLVNYEARDAESLIAALHEAVDDYITDCKNAQKEPDKPFKGSFNVRIGSDLHQKISLYALDHEDTLNNVVKNALNKFIDIQESRPK